ncbi:protein tramtrack, beta isoform-like isoform X1 [Diaphorina citri]|uniref:Protein tramtrack, beta isoform-like isoform X1 n=1 Tax=Diaphorina citri TaxID=121845 RepID=A0A1S3CTN8_DIACI|nr:protein tramtrack, beta isoform-like isoform X1 [Diaphorina citri]
MANELFCLKWNNYTSNIITELDSLRTDGDLVDVTILCDGRKITAHKVILSACSSYFRTIFRENPCQHPVVILKDINYEDIEAVLCFVYQGTVYISKSRMDSFLKTAESLQIKGLAGASNMMGDNEENRNISSDETSKIVKRSKPVPPLASVSTNVPAPAPTVPVTTPTSKRRKLFPNSNRPEDGLEEDSNLMSNSKSQIQNEDSRSMDSSLVNQHDRHSLSGVGMDKDSIDPDEESNTYNNTTTYSSTGEVEDDNQMQYTDDNEEEDDDGDASGSISPVNSISTQSSGQVPKVGRASSREVKEECLAEAFTNTNLNVHVAMETSTSVVEPPIPLGEIVKTETISPTNSPFYSGNMLPQTSSGVERTPAKKSTTTVNYSQGTPGDANRGQQSFTEEELPAERLGRRPCPLCLKIISNKSNLLKHIRIRHNTDYYDQAKCPKCYKNFKNKYSLRAHINIYHKENTVQTMNSGEFNNVKEDQYSYSNILEPPPMMAQPTSMTEQYFGIMSTTNLPNMNTTNLPNLNTTNLPNLNTNLSNLTTTSLPPESISLSTMNSLSSPVFLTQSLTSSAMSSTS